MNSLRVTAALIVTILALGAAPLCADGGKEDLGPLEITREYMEDALKILRDPDLQGEDHREERREKLRDAVEHAFDWPEIGRRALARHWWNRSEEQKQEFIELFKKLLERTYMKRVEENADAQISYEGQTIEGEYASVRVLAIADDGTEVPILYRLHRLSDAEQEEKDTSHRWLVYDVKVEGVSLVNNYRSQFNDIIVGGSYKRLIRKLRKKVGD
jgi:phospholipid transport system substrate-binding protein